MAQSLAYVEKLIHFRGIALLDVIVKLYMVALMLWAGTLPVPAHHKCAVIAAYSAGTSAAHVALILASLLRKGSEWEEHHPVYIFSGDMYSVFD